MVSMIQIMGTGVDIKDLNITINASANGSDVATIQLVGRGKRRALDKTVNLFIDFSDEGLFQPHANKRIKVLKEYGNEVNVNHVTEWREVIKLE